MLKLITLNVQRNNHWDRIIPFLESEQADVVCLQEFFDEDIERLEELGYELIGFQPIVIFPDDSNRIERASVQGNILFSKLPFKNPGMEYYHIGADPLPLYDRTSTETIYATQNMGLLWATFEKDGAPYTIAITQFTWTPDGYPNDMQEKNIEKMLTIARKHPELIFCGDFNIPRKQNNLYSKLVEHFSDAIPEDITCSLDMELHRAANHPVQGPRIAQFMVDYILHTPQYQVRDVRRVCGVSDHCAMVGNIEKIPKFI